MKRNNKYEYQNRGADGSPIFHFIGNSFGISMKQNAPLRMHSYSVYYFTKLENTSLSEICIAEMKIVASQHRSRAKSSLANSLLLTDWFIDDKLKLRKRFIVDKLM